MSKYLSVMCALAMMATFSAHAAETIYVGGASGSIEQIFKEKIIPAFETKTGAKLFYLPGNSTDMFC